MAFDKNLQDSYNLDLKPAFEKEIEELTVLTKDPFEKRAIEYFDLISWLKTKTENRTMEDVMSEMATKDKISRGIM